MSERSRSACKAIQGEPANAYSVPGMTLYSLAAKNAAGQRDTVTAAKSLAGWGATWASRWRPLLEEQ